MTGIATTMILAALAAFFLGLMGLIKGNVNMLGLRSRKASALLMGAALVIFIIGGGLLPAEENGNNGQTDSGQTVSKEDQSVQKEDKKKSEQAEPVSKAVHDGKMEVHFIDIGQGASQVIMTPSGKVMVLDGGNNDDEERMVAYLNKLGVKKIDILIGTHPDADHIGGIDAVIDAFDIGRIYMPKVQKNTETFQSVLRSIQAKSLKVTTAKAGIKLDLGSGVSADMIGPISANPNHNEMSAIVRIVYGKHSFLLTADAGFPAEEDLLASGTELKSTVLLVGHHGSDHSSSTPFLKAVRPDYAVIQVGENNYGHPRETVLSRLAEVNAKILRNDLDGTIIFTTNGAELKVKTDKTGKAKAAPIQKTVKKENAINKEAAASAEAPAAGSISASAAIDNRSPGQNESVAVTVTVKDSKGNPVKGASVSLSLAFKSIDTVYEGEQGLTEKQCCCLRSAGQPKGSLSKGQLL